MIFIDNNNWNLPESYSDSKEPLIILCEQDWDIKGDNCSRSSLQGIDLAQHLRRVRNVKNPIIFTSFLPTKKILELQKAQIITAVGHSFLRLPYTSSELNSTIQQLESLSEMQLKDIATNFCSARSAFSETMHTFKNRLRILMTSGDEEELKREISEFGRLLKEQYSSFPGMWQTFQDAIKKHTSQKEQAAELLSQTDNYYLKFIPSESTDSPIDTYRQFAWKVLLLDDEPEGIQHVFEEFQKRQIKVISCKNVAEAKAEIEQDGDNSIAVVISDFRLMETPSAEWPSGRMQAEQGYDFLLWLSKQKRMSAMVALSGLSRQFLTDSFRKQQLDIKVYSKNEVDNGARLFVDDIEHLGETFFDMVIHQPKWGSDLAADIYRSFRLCKGFQAMEAEISERACRVCKDIYAQMTLAETNEDFLLTHLDEFGNAQQAFSAKDSAEESEQKLMTKLILRRIAIYSHCMGLNRKTIAQLLSYGNLKKDMDDNNVKQVFLKLYFQTSEDVPYRILSEERSWLQQEMGVPIYEMSELLNATVPILNQQVNKIVSQLKKGKSFEIPDKYLDNNGRIVCLSISHLKALVNTILRKDNDATFRERLQVIAFQLREILPHNEEVKELLKSIRKFDESETRRDVRN